MKYKIHNQLELTLTVSSTQTTGVPMHPLIRDWITELMPELLNGSERSDLLLRSINTFLSATPDQTCEAVLRLALDEDLFFCLLGLKSILTTYDHSWEHAQHCFQQDTKTLSLIINNHPKR